MENQPIESNDERVYWWKKVFNKTNIIIVVIIILVTRALFWVSCGEKEKTLPVPKFLEGTQIGFDNQMHYQLGEQQEGTETFKNINKQIVPDTDLGSYYPGRFTYEKVSTSTRFSVVGALNHANCGLSAIDSGTRGVDFLILQDEHGNKYLVAYISLVFSGTYNPVANGFEALNASYYKNGEKVDFIRKSDFVFE